MKKLTADDPETRSADIVSANIAQLETLWPEAFTDIEPLVQVGSEVFRA